jgi:hypothetical protein
MGFVGVPCRSYYIPEIIVRFIHNVSKESLQNYLDSKFKPISNNIDWCNPENQILDYVIEVLNGLKQEEFTSIYNDVERISEMTDELGQSALLSLMGNIEHYLSLKNGYDRALWVFLNNYELFCQAEAIRYTDYYRLGDMCDGFIVPKSLGANIDLQQLYAFKEAIRDQFKYIGGIKVELFKYNRSKCSNCASRYIQIIIYFEGLANNHLAFEDNKLVRKLIRSTKKRALTYDSDSGYIEVVAEGKAYRENLVKIFLVTLLGVKVGYERISLKRYDITKLMYPYDFPTDLEDGIESVKVTMLGLKTYDNCNKITIEVAPEVDKNIYDKLKEWFDSNDPLTQGFLLDKVRLLIKFFSNKENPNGVVLPLQIISPNRCNLGSKTRKEQLIGEKYLARWGLLEKL